METIYARRSKTPIVHMCQRCYQSTSGAQHGGLFWISQEVIKLEKTIYKNAENKQKSLSLEYACLPRPGTTFSLYGD